MRLFYFLLSLVATISLIVVLNSAIGPLPPLGSFMSPQHGFWQNAEKSSGHSAESFVLKGVKNPVSIYFDDRFVPHVFAENVEDAYFAQGYLHAFHRLWQMEFQTFAAAGRLSEILGAGPDSAYLNNDRRMRRMGMVYGAEQTLSAMQEDPETLSILKSYTEGVNSYIDRLSLSALPLEYRLLNYRPERWSDLKTALLLKYLSYDLTGSGFDLEHTNIRKALTGDLYARLYPLMHDDTDPIVPKGTVFDSATVAVKTPGDADSLYFQWRPATDSITRPDPDNGSNNWVVSGNKTRSGRPILCNDPHLGLNLPSLWYEIHLNTPEMNVYGASLPGAPSVIIGFNDHIAWGETNASRDVLDLYAIRFRNADRSEYQLNGEWKKPVFRIEPYKIKGGDVFYDTVAYTVFGPVLYDTRFPTGDNASSGQHLALRWKAHDPSNELKTFLLLNRARNYEEYLKAIRHFQSPGQNFAFASRDGDIAIWQQGNFPVKWKGQGNFVMPGTDTAYAWNAFIPQEENPHSVNPDRGFVSSANQIPADTSYPYYLGGDYDVYRGLLINRRLQESDDITPADMMALQNENYNAFAEKAMPLLLYYTEEKSLNHDEIRFLGAARSWNFRNDPEGVGPTVFSTWTDALDQLIWNDELSAIDGVTTMPESFTLIDLLKNDSSFVYVDDIRTPEKETLRQQVTAAFKKAVTSLVFAEKDGRLNWSAFKDAGVRHLLRIEPFSRYHLTTGGGRHVINATKQFHGPSWKMVVHLTDDPEAYGIYPGGQTGNPGSPHYDQFVGDWAEGKYYRLWLMKKEDRNDDRIRKVISITPEQLTVNPNRK